jgi:hypothetical protein
VHSTLAELLVLIFGSTRLCVSLSSSYHNKKHSPHSDHRISIALATTKTTTVKSDQFSIALLLLLMLSCFNRFNCLLLPILLSFMLARYAELYDVPAATRALSYLQLARRFYLLITFPLAITMQATVMSAGKIVSLIPP